MASKNFSLSGMPDFSSQEVKRREYVFSIMKRVFEKYGFSPLETPAIEKRESLIGNYGSEGDKLVYQLLKSGDFFSKIDKKEILKSDYNIIAPLISDKALRYDLTIPFARYVSNNQSKIILPFKRYQIQKVWRADRPQKGRLREFTQCDVDVIGSKSIWLESDLVKICDEVFNSLKLNDVVLKLNNRKILEGLYDFLSPKFSFSDFCVSLDKIDKYGKDGFVNFLKINEVTKKNILFFESLFSKSFSIKNFNSEFSSLFDFNNQSIEDGKNEIMNLFSKISNLKTLKVEFDFSLARGLDYYTGMIFEIKTDKLNIGSIGGGGRYDNLTTLFGNNIGSGVGISFGVERILICLTDLKLFPKDLDYSIDLMFVNLGEKESILSQSYVDQMRDCGIKCEIFPDNVKLKKQMSYANKKKINYVAFVGDEELKTKKITLKNMINGTQESISLKAIINKLKNE